MSDFSCGLLTATTPQSPTFRPNGALLCGPAVPVPTKVGLGQQTALTTVAEVDHHCDYAHLPFLLLGPVVWCMPATPAL